MDFSDLIPLIIIALVFLFGRSSKKKAEEAKKTAERALEGPVPGTMESGETASAAPVTRPGPSLDRNPRDAAAGGSALAASLCEFLAFT